MLITELKSPWRQKFQQAWFRGAIFYVDADARAGGRRVALHQYPKRNIPYAEDMGRTANNFSVQGFLIGPNYLDDRDILIACLEQDGPGLLRLPMPYQGSDVQVMVQSYIVTETRQQGGYCTVEMTFVEYGDPAFRQTISSGSQIQTAASNVESAVAGPATADTAQQTQPYADVFNSAKVADAVPYLPQDYPMPPSQTGGATGSW
jgi:prophage DNA circulation protein